jgi:hypothetical protein
MLGQEAAYLHVAPSQISRRSLSTREYGFLEKPTWIKIPAC